MAVAANAGPVRDSEITTKNDFMVVNTTDRSSDPRRLAKDDDASRDSKKWKAFKIFAFTAFVICQASFELTTIGVSADDDWYDM
jgi:hypothetical protein